MHVTLRFLGLTYRKDVVNVLKTVEGDTFTLRIGAATEMFDKSILYVPASGADALARAVTDATQHLGKPPENRPFVGHVTLARTKGRKRIDLDNLDVPGPLELPVDRFVLMRSLVCPRTKVALYEKVEEFRLKGTT